MKKEILKLYPAFKDYLWGGKRLKEFYGVTDKDKVSEAWVLSAHKDGESTVMNGECKGLTFGEALAKTEKTDKEFPLLIKLIDAADNLSVQVHPSDDYAKTVENQRGKTEMWYVLEAEAGAGIYCGFKEDITKEEFEKSISDGTLCDKLSFTEVKKGDCFYIPSGTVHAICKGVLIAEIQQSSNLTYRVYDYLRKGADGKPRELHIKKALDVADTGRYTFSCPESVATENGVSVRPLVKSEYFTSTEIGVDGSYTLDTAFGFKTFLVTEGEGRIGDIEFGKYDCFYLPADIGKVSLKGKFKAIIS